jgi:tRNA 2-thiouridine synthesizing protein A
MQNAGHDHSGGAEAASPDAPVLIVDALGRRCPVPVILLAERIGDVQPGQLVELLADDAVARTDLPAWCALKSHELVRLEERPAGWSFLVRRSH